MPMERRGHDFSTDSPSDPASFDPPRLR